MCTAVSYSNGDHYFGRNLDLEYHYDEKIVITPQNFPFHFKRKTTLSAHYAMIGMATVIDNTPLYYEATNECGLSIAGLNFPGNAVYQSELPGKDNIAPNELIPWILGQCCDVTSARALLINTNLVNEAFSPELHLTPLHFMISDRCETIVAEPMSNGLNIYDNPIKVLTNNPPFPYHLSNICNYMNLSNQSAKNNFSKWLDLSAYSNGMGAMGLPGDLSSASRFVRAAFVRNNSISNVEETKNVSQFFHILKSVEHPRGCVQIGKHYEITQYSSCCNTDKGIYYYTTYENSQISAVNMRNVDLQCDQMITYPLIDRQQISYQN